MMRMPTRRRFMAVVMASVACVGLEPPTGRAAEPSSGPSSGPSSPAAAVPRRAADRGLAESIEPLWHGLTGRRPTFAIRGTVRLKPGADDEERVEIRIERFGADDFDVEAAHPAHAFVLRRRADMTALAVPRRGIVHVGRGDLDPQDHLDPRGLAARLMSGDSLASLLPPMLAQSTAGAAVTLATQVLGLKTDGAGGWRVGDVAIRIDADDPPAGFAVQRPAGFAVQRPADFAAATSVTVLGPGFQADLQIADAGTAAAADEWPGLEVSTVPRAELERTVARGVRRGLEIVAPGPALVTPEPVDRDVPHGTLRWIGGHRVVTLHGTPEQIGAAHGELVGAEATRCLDSVLHVVGLVETVRDGRWFRRRLEEALARLAPHIPARHREEMRALAVAAGHDPDVLETVNVFPELFHCSGFAVMGSATADGTLYHGRVLDYMTEIGLQHAAVTFVVQGVGVVPFVSVGYAGFVGSVSGMNERGISLGEMGGRGEGDWDGVPMATLMRRALEECRSLEEVMDLWRRSPRTCEYYYVFADGGSRRAVGVKATPQAVEFVGPGEAHPLLGPGIPDAIALSAGERLECLRGRIAAGHGRIDEAAAVRLMDRPVAMRSNLHNVLFVPEKLRLHVAHAAHGRPAAEEPAVVLDLAALLAAIPPVVARRPGATFDARDSLAPGPEENPDARACLDGLRWQPGPFRVRIEEAADGHGDLVVRFPSPLPGGVPVNDVVAMEWYLALDADGEPLGPETLAPACVVVHESGSGMPFGRLFARGLAARGVHACMIHLPFYGQRRPPGRHPGPEAIIGAVRQAVADVRRAADAVAALPGIDGGRIGLEGTSLGGFVAATAGAIDDRFSRVFILLAGGDIAGVIAHGRRDARALRDRLAAAGMTEARVHETVAAVEPLRLAHRLDPDRTWLYSAAHDDVVPPRHARLLAEAAGLRETHHVELHANHYTGIIYLPLVLTQIRNHIVTGKP